MICPAPYCRDGIVGFLPDGSPFLCGRCDGEGLSFPYSLPPFTVKPYIEQPRPRLPAVVAALLVLALAIPAAAAPPAKPPEFPRILGITVLGKALDLYSTADCIEAGCHEANPLQPTVEHRVAFGAATSVLAAVGFYELEKRDTRFRWGKWAYFAIHVGVAASNEWQARKARRQH